MIAEKKGELFFMKSCTITIKDTDGKIIRNAILHNIDEVKSFYYEVCRAGLFDGHGDEPYFRGNLKDITVSKIFSSSDDLRTSIPLHESESRANCRCADVDMSEPNRLKAIAFAFSQSVPCLETGREIIVTD